MNLMSVEKLPLKILIQILMRSFLLQASWNFERLQSLGALYVLAPGLRFYYQGKELVDAFQRHLEYFNTHPYMASPVLGAALTLEEARKRGDQSPLGVQEFKNMIMAPYAAMGDALFWGALRPLSACLALFWAAKGSLWAPVVFLLVFNVPHLWMRIAGFWQGYRSGIAVVDYLQRRSLPDLALRVKEATIVLLGGLVAYLSYRCVVQEEWKHLWGLGVLPAVILFSWLVRRGVSVLAFCLTCVFVLLLVTQTA